MGNIDCISWGFFPPIFRCFFCFFFGLVWFGFWILFFSQLHLIHWLFIQSDSTSYPSWLGYLISLIFFSCSIPIHWTANISDYFSRFSCVLLLIYLVLDCMFFFVWVSTTMRKEIYFSDEPTKETIAFSPTDRNQSVLLFLLFFFFFFF